MLSIFRSASLAGLPKLIEFLSLGFSSCGAGAPPLFLLTPFCRFGYDLVWSSDQFTRVIVSTPTLPGRSASVEKVRDPEQDRHRPTLDAQPDMHPENQQGARNGACPPRPAKGLLFRQKGENGPMFQRFGCCCDRRLIWGQGGSTFGWSRDRKALVANDSTGGLFFQTRRIAAKGGL